MTVKICPVCRKNEAQLNPTLGVLPCLVCQEKRRTRRVSEAVEFTSDQIKEDRKVYKDDILQPFRAGELSKEYLRRYGTRGLSVTKEEIKKAVNTTDSYYD